MITSLIYPLKTFKGISKNIQEKDFPHRNLRISNPLKSLCSISFALFILWGTVLLPKYVFATPASADTFNQLVLLKSGLESRYGIKRLECFPFQKNIGDDANQIQLIDHCLSGAETLKASLDSLGSTPIQTVGVSHRFLRTGGFHTILIPWNTTQEALTEFLNAGISVSEQEKFLNQIRAVKSEILSRIGQRGLFCTQRISNKDCMKGYRAIVGALKGMPPQKVSWREINVSSAGDISEDPWKLSLAFDATSDEIKQALFRSGPYEVWEARRKMYEKIKEEYAPTYKSNLQLSNFFCTPELSVEQCLKAAKTLHKASESGILQNKHWGEVWVNSTNNLLVNDFDSQVRFDLETEQMIEFFSRKPGKDAIEKNTVLAEKLEEGTKNNSSRLRVVCDPVDLSAHLCVQGFQTFRKFLKENRKYVVSSPWTELMFIDGNQLKRVNFALNSNVRHNYIYMSADTGYESLKAHMMKFKSKH